MVRTNRRKGIEEVYGTKLEALQPSRPQSIPQPGMTKTATLRVASSRQGDTRTQRSYVTANDYFITTNVPLNASNMRNAASGVLHHPSKTSQMPVQMQSATTQVTPYGAASNRRGKPIARQPISGLQPKVHFVSGENNKPHVHSHAPHTHPHGHTHAHAKSMQAMQMPNQIPMHVPMQMPMQMTQRNVFEMDPNITDASEKDLHSSTKVNTRRAQMPPHPHPLPHPPQHQLHQQQQLNHPNNNNNQHQMHQSQHHNLKHQHSHPQQNQRQSRSHHVVHMPVVTEEEDEKDDDPEEFFELIRQTVKTAVGTTISDVVTRNFCELAIKMERFSNELKMTNDNLGKLQNDIANKVTHYGEENSRHFRYLCMKSEYDKMFYQHQTMVTAKGSSTKVAAGSQANLDAMPMANKVAKQAAAFSQKSVKQQLAAGKLKKVANNESVKSQNPCACRNTSKSPQQQQNQSSSEQSLNANSSDMGVREVLGQIQRFCTQMQQNEVQPKYNSQAGHSKMESSEKPSYTSGTLGGESASNDDSNKSKKHILTNTPNTDARDLESDTPLDSMDETEIDNFQYSSDEFSSYSDDSDHKFDGNATARAPLHPSRAKTQIKNSNKGAGDGH